ncbi:MAG: hypothetical protein AAFN94_06115 [Pseudomonadota bacterium]
MRVTPLYRDGVQVAEIGITQEGNPVAPALDGLRCEAEVLSVTAQLDLADLMNHTMREQNRAQNNGPAVPDPKGYGALGRWSVNLGTGRHFVTHLEADSLTRMRFVFQINGAV